MLRYPITTMRNRLMICFNIYGVNINRKNHSKSDFCIEQLKNRQVIRISGEGSSDFLQGLITNDISNLVSSMYTMFLNNRGRILFDSFIYKSSEKNCFLLECDSEAVSQFIKHLNIYKLRRKVDISPLGSELSVWCIYNPVNIDKLANQNIAKESQSYEAFDISTVNNNNIIITADPRTRLLGHRVVIRDGEEVTNLAEGDSYQICRYKLGIGEGIDELLSGKGFPLEMNCDYLQGVSFNKGCYIGQELTARIFHTGVIRKRLMPLVFETEALGIPVNSPIEDLTQDRKSPIGKLRAINGKYGLGLMRVSDTLESKSLKILNCIAKSYVPAWWPEESVQQTYVKIKK